MCQCFLAISESYKLLLFVTNLLGFIREIVTNLTSQVGYISEPGKIEVRRGPQKVGLLLFLLQNKNDIEKMFSSKKKLSPLCYLRDQRFVNNSAICWELITDFRFQRLYGNRKES